jgi:hypothetical protein
MLASRHETELIGWTAAAILLATLGRQVYPQWRHRTSNVFPSGFLLAKAPHRSGCHLYSWLVESWVFVAKNALTLLTACLARRCIAVLERGARGLQRANMA